MSHFCLLRYKEENKSSEEKSDEEDCGILEVQVQRLSGVMRENITDFITDPHGSHVLRTLIHVLAGCMTPEPSDAQHGNTHTHTQTHVNLRLESITVSVRYS